MKARGPVIFKAKSCISGLALLPPSISWAWQDSGQKPPPSRPSGHLHAPEGVSEPPWGLRGLPPAPAVNRRVKVINWGKSGPSFWQSCHYTHLGSFSRQQHWRPAAQEWQPGRDAGARGLGQRTWGSSRAERARWEQEQRSCRARVAGTASPAQSQIPWGAQAWMAPCRGQELAAGLGSAHAQRKHADV